MREKVDRRSGGGGGVPRRRRTDVEPNRGWRPVLLIAIAVAIVDWSTKAVITSTVPLGDLVVVIDGRLAFWHVQNPALILGLFGDLPLQSRKVIAAFLGLATFVLLLQVITRAHRLLPHRRPWAWLFAGLLLGGMLGNLGERTLHWWVTDFISFRWRDLWLPPGNVADLAILIAIPISVLVIAFEFEARSLRRYDPRPANAELRNAPDPVPSSGE